MPRPRAATSQAITCWQEAGVYGKKPEELRAGRAAEEHAAAAMSMWCLLYCCTADPDRMGRPNRSRPSACRSLELNEFARQTSELSPLNLTGRKSGPFTEQSMAPTPSRMPRLGYLWMQYDVGV